MSLSKELCLRSDSENSDSFSGCFRHKIQLKEDNYRRDSFDDRFCDDLSISLNLEIKAKTLISTNCFHSSYSKASQI